MTYCTGCGATLRPGLRFCERCGCSVAGGKPLRMGKRWLFFGLLLSLGLGGWWFSQRGVKESPKTEISQPEPEPVAVQSPRVAVPPAPEAATTPLQTEDIPGIEEVSLADPATYLPIPGNRYRCFRTYPDGDKGVVEKIVARVEDGGIVAISFAESSFFPEDPPTVSVARFQLRQDGVYQTYDGQSVELFLPSDLRQGKKWQTRASSFEVLQYDSTIAVEGQTFQGALAIQVKNNAVGSEETFWLAPGHGEVMRRYGQTGEVSSKLLSAESVDADEMEKLVSKYAGK